MHEQGLALSIVEALLAEGFEGRHVRVHVSGGHTAQEAFDAALAAHLNADSRISGEFDIVHDARNAVCSACAAIFAAQSEQAECPICGGAPLPSSAEEQLTIELLESAAGAGD